MLLDSSESLYDKFIRVIAYASVNAFRKTDDGALHRSRYSRFGQDFENWSEFSGFF